MRFRALAAPAIVLAAAAACSDSTAPGSIARHIDTLYQQACARAYVPPSAFANSGSYDTTSVYWQRCQLLSVLLAGPASGAEPSPLRVMTGGGARTWRAIIISEYDTLSTGAPYTTINTMIAYSDANVTTAVVAFMLSDGNNGVYILANDTVTKNGTVLSAASSTSSLGSSCHDTPGLANPLADTLTGYPPIEYGGATCRIGVFDAALNATFPTTPGLDSSLQSITIDRQTVNGIHVVPSAFYFERLRSWR